MTDTAPITEGLYPERPLSAALTDEAKRALVAQGYAEGEGNSWRVTNAAALPGYATPTAAGPVSLADSTAAELVALLRDQPDMVGAVEAAERDREDGPRQTVLDAVERARK